MTPFLRPYMIRGYAVLDGAGRIVAQGSPELCAAVVASPTALIVERQGGLFDAHD